MNTNQLANLERKFGGSGIDGKPVITDSEIQYMIDSYNEMQNYFSAIGHHMISLAFIMKIQECKNVLNARKSARNGWKS